MKEIAITNNSLLRGVIIGAGFAGLNLARALLGKPVQLILLDQNSIGLKSINDAINLRSWILQNLERSVDGSTEEEKQKLIKSVVVGGGPAGVEMAGALAEFKKIPPA